MPDNTQVPGEHQPNPGDQSSDHSVANPGDSTGHEVPGYVKRESHQKLLAEKKRLAEQMAEKDAQLAKFEADQRQREEDDLQAKEDFKTMLENRDKELAETKSELTNLKTHFSESRKLDAVLSTMQKPLPKKYWGLIPLDEVAIDPTTGNPDEMSVTNVVEKFKETYPEVIAGPIPGVGNHLAPNGNGGASISVDDYNAMSLADKKKNFNNVAWKSDRRT